MANHRLEAGPETVHWGFFDAELKPLLTGEQRRHGHDLDRLRHGEPDAGSAAQGAARARGDPQERAAEASRPHVYRSGRGQRRQGGQALEVRIKDIELHYDWGYNMIRPLAGALPDDFRYADTDSHPAR